MAADLLKSNTVDYKALAKQYSEFQVPDVRAVIGSEQYSAGTASNRWNNKPLICQVDAHLYHQEGTAVSITLENVYDLESSRFQNLASLGDPIRVAIGYSSVRRQIFTGYVGEIQLQYSGVRQRVRITGLDAVSLMAQCTAARYYQEQTYADVVSAIVQKYKGVLTEGKIDAAGEQKKSVLSCRDKSDYAYLTEVLCPMAGKEFYVFDGKAYFQSIGDRCQTPTVQLKLGQSLTDFRLTASYGNLGVTVSSTEGADAQKILSGKAQGKAHTAQKNAVPMSQDQYFPWLRAADSAAVSNIAAYWAQEQTAARQTAEGTCIGIPELVPGRCIAIDGIGSPWDSKRFWLDHVHHVIGADGFTTEFYVKGWT